MIFTETRLRGAFVIEPERLEDERGFFARVWCQREFAAHGLSTALAQSNLSFNRQQGTLRGLHYQATPHQEIKLVRCTRGAIYDVIVDLRPESRTFKQHAVVVLSAENHKALYVPEGFAHGFQTLQDNTEVLYQMSAFYVPESARAVRWDDPGLAIAWPLPVSVISARDREAPDLTAALGVRV